MSDAGFGPAALKAACEKVCQPFPSTIGILQRRCPMILRYGGRFALKLAGHGYIRHQPRSHGINLGWFEDSPFIAESYPKRLVPL
jgi:hypothetical protein